LSQKERHHLIAISQKPVKLKPRVNQAQQNNPRVNQAQQNNQIPNYSLTIHISNQLDPRVNQARENNQKLKPVLLTL